METAKQDPRNVLAEWARLFVTYVEGTVESPLGREQVLAREPDIIAATLTIKKKLGLAEMEPFQAAVRSEWKRSSVAVQKAAQTLLEKIETQAAPSKKPKWKTL